MCVCLPEHTCIRFPYHPEYIRKRNSSIDVVWHSVAGLKITYPHIYSAHVHPSHKPTYSIACLRADLWIDGFLLLPGWLVQRNFYRGQSIHARFISLTTTQQPHSHVCISRVEDWPFNTDTNMVDLLFIFNTYVGVYTCMHTFPHIRVYTGLIHTYVSTICAWIGSST